MKVAVINIPSKVGRDAWERCFRLTAERAPVFGVNEAFLRSAKDLYRDLARELGYDHFGISKGPNPVFWDKKKYSLVNARQVKLHDVGPNYRAYPGFNDRRYVTVVVLRDKRTGDVMTVLNTHWVPEGKRVPEWWRRWARLQCKAKCWVIIRRQRKQGRTVFFIGDTNIHKKFFLGRGFQWIRGTGIDKMGVAAPFKHKVINRWYKLYDAPTDHKRGVVGGCDIKKVVTG